MFDTNLSKRGISTENHSTRLIPIETLRELYQTRTFKPGSVKADFPITLDELSPTDALWLVMRVFQLDNPHIESLYEIFTDRLDYSWFCKLFCASGSSGQVLQVIETDINADLEAYWLEHVK